MKFLIINSDYPDFLKSLYNSNSNLKFESYDRQLEVRNESLFSVANFYSENLKKMGHDAWEVHVNNEYMQKAWLDKFRKTNFFHRMNSPLNKSIKGKVFDKRSLIRNPLLLFNFNYKYSPDYFKILATQIETYQPDVILNQDLGISPDFFRSLRGNYKYLIGQEAVADLSPKPDLSCYDLILSSFPPTVDYYLGLGIPAEYISLGFEPKILSNLYKSEEKYDVTFIGGLGNIHSKRLELLDNIAKCVPNFKIWGCQSNNALNSSAIRKCYCGEAWGSSMYQILFNSKITINCHIDGYLGIMPYANNLRLFEATGVGTLLITDWKKNLSDLFIPRSEVVDYRSPQECIELINYYLENTKERKKIANAGQERTLKDHNYYIIMKKMISILDKYI